MSARTFAGGIHPAYNKDRTRNQTVADFEAPKTLVFPVSQHIGAPAVPCVAKGDEVKVGQKIADAGGFVSAPIFSSVSGKVVSIEPRMGGMGVLVESIVIENDQAYTIADMSGLDWRQASGETLRDAIRDGGIVGMGGATFPTHVKLSPPANKPINTLVINGAECEPYLTADHRIMVEFPTQVVTGVQILQKVLGCAVAIIGIEENKPDAIAAIEAACKETDIQVMPLAIKYPQGGEKQLIDATLGRQVPSGGLPMDVGVVVQNVGTAKAVSDAVVNGRPLISRVVTVTGDGVPSPGNFHIPLGTPVSAVLTKCGVDLEQAGKLILGGPMMGFAQFSSEAPVIKGTSGILVLSKKAAIQAAPRPCIRCSRCVGACPMHLVPQQIAAFSDHQLFDNAAGADALDCMECGSCAHECPSKIPLVQKIRLAKTQIMAKKRKERRAS